MPQYSGPQAPFQCSNSARAATSLRAFLPPLDKAGEMGFNKRFNDDDDGDDETKRCGSSAWQQ